MGAPFGLGLPRLAGPAGPLSPLLWTIFNLTVFFLTRPYQNISPKNYARQTKCNFDFSFNYVPHCTLKTTRVHVRPAHTHSLLVVHSCTRVDECTHMYATRKAHKRSFLFARWWLCVDELTLVRPFVGPLYQKPFNTYEQLKLQKYHYEHDKWLDSLITIGVYAKYLFIIVIERFYYLSISISLRFYFFIKLNFKGF